LTIFIAMPLSSNFSHSPVFSATSSAFMALANLIRVSPFTPSYRVMSSDNILYSLSPAVSSRANHSPSVRRVRMRESLCS
jgi:hypothetical protein